MNITRLRQRLGALSGCRRCRQHRLRAAVFVALLWLGIDGLVPHAADAPPKNSPLGLLESLPQAAARVASAVNAAASSVQGLAASAAGAVNAASGALSAASGVLRTLPAGAAPRTAASTQPVAPQTPASPVPLPAATATPVPSLQLLYESVPMPSARLDETYGPKLMVEGGRPPYAITVIDGRLPPGLTISPDGRLTGVPTRVGVFPFALGVADASTPAQTARQAYTLRVQVPRSAVAKAAAAAAPASAAASAAAKTLSSVDPADTDLLGSKVLAGNVLTWMLTDKDLESLGVPPPAAGAASAPEAPAGAEPLTSVPATPAAAASAVPAYPLAEQLAELVAPLTNIEYPTRALFLSALDAAHCSYYFKLTREIASQQGATPPKDCPPAAEVVPKGKAAAPARAASGIPLAQFHEHLLPPDLRDKVVDAARKLHPLDKAKPPLWVGRQADGRDCGCAPVASLGHFEAFYPFWAAGDTPQAVDFSLLNRIGYLGLVPDDKGDYLRPQGWEATHAAFARAAQRHGTQVDLVLHRHDWSSLLRLPASEQLNVAETAAKTAVALIDTTPQDLDASLNDLLLPFWREPAAIYSGITVDFDQASRRAASPADFARFFDAFMRQLIASMQKRAAEAPRRSFALNIVVPAERLGEPGAFSVERLLNYLVTAEPTSLTAVNEQADPADYKDKSPVTVRFIVPLAEPTTTSKKVLREKIDATSALSGAPRVAVLQSIVPMLFHSGVGDEGLDAGAARQLGDDLQYLWWNFGGVALSPPPMPGAGAGTDVGDKLISVFQLRKGVDVTGLCRIVCPNRVALRLLLQGLIVVGLVSIGAYLASCNVRRLGRPYLVFLFVGGLITLLVAGALLSCDPALGGLRNSNTLFYAVIALLFLGGVYLTFRPRVDPP